VAGTGVIGMAVGDERTRTARIGSMWKSPGGQ